MRKHYPLNSQGAEDAGRLPWTDGVPSTGVEGSYPGQALFTDTEAEILAAIDASGQARNGSDLTQLVQAIARGLYLGQFTGTANALTAALANNVAFASLLRGMRFTGFVTATNTAGVTVAITCLTGANAVVQAPLLTKAGNALAAGDLPVNQDFEIRWDGTVFRMVGSVASDGGSTSNATPIAQAAKTPFNLQKLVTQTRTAASAAQAGLNVTVVSGVTYSKKSATSTIVVWANYQTYSTTVNGAITARLSIGSGYADAGTTNGLTPAGSSQPLQFATSPIFFITGVGAGPQALTLALRRDDNASWTTIFNPTGADVSGYPSPNTATFVIAEVEI